MSHIEEAVIRRFSGLHLLMAGIVIAVTGAAPLLLYIAFGPADGNPVGLGFLAMIAVPAGGVGAGVGLIKMLVAHFTRGRE